MARTNDTPPLDSSDPESLGRFRYAAAGLIKSLIRARATQCPDFLTAKDRRRWKVEDLDSEKRSCAVLLYAVKLLRKRFEQKYLAHRDSVPGPSVPGPSVPGQEDEVGELDQLIDQVASFVCGDLDEAIRKAIQGKEVGWDKLADWDTLAKIRDVLDKLPDPWVSAVTLKRTSPCTLRNLYFLLWYEDEHAETYHSNAKIRDRWNQENPRRKVSPGDKRAGYDLVKKGILAARRFLAKNDTNVQAAIAALERQKG